MTIRLYMSLNDALARKLLIRAEKEKLELDQILVKAANAYVKDDKK